MRSSILYILLILVNTLVFGLSGKSIIASEKVVVGIDTIRMELYGINGNGKYDNTIKIQKIIDSLNKGGVLSFPEGKYLISNLVIRNPNITILGSGDKTVFLSVNSHPSLHKPTMWITKNNCTIKDIKITYKSWENTGYKSFGIPRIDGNSWYGSHIATSYNEIYTSKRSKHSQIFNNEKLQVVRNLTIDNVTIVGTSLHAIYLANCTHSVVKNCNIQQVRATGIMGYGVGNIKIENNYFESLVDDVVFLCAPHFALNDVYTPLMSSDMKSIQIINNESHKTGTKVWCACGFDGVLIHNNYSDENRGDCIWTGAEPSAGAKYGSRNVTISNNILNNVFGGFGELINGYPSKNDIVKDGTSYAGAITHNGKGNGLKINNNIVNISPKITALEGRNLYLFNIFDCEDVQIENNKFNNVKRGGVIGRQTDNIKNIINVNILNNYFEGNPDTEFVSVFRGSDKVSIRYNSFKYNGSYSTQKSFIKCWENENLFIENNNYNNRIGFIKGQGGYYNFKQKNNNKINN